MLIDLPYGKKFVQVKIPNHVKVVYPKEQPITLSPKSEIRRSLDNPIGCTRLPEIARGKTDAIIIINDFTRPAPTDLMLEGILADLKTAGIQPDAVTVLIACGNHRPSTQEEIKHMVGQDLFTLLHFINHNCEDTDNLTFLGETDGGLPIWINSLVVRASLKILTGLITPHHGAGYSGGRKSLVPGVTGLKTLKKHHSFPIRSYMPSIGWMKGNPFHEEAVKAARTVGVDVILNVVKNTTGEIVKAVAGEMEAAHEKGVEICEQSGAIPFSHKFDIIIVTPGGFPRDIDLHQAQKALSIAELIIEDSGIIVLVAECQDGIGKFGEWLKTAKSPDEVIERFRIEGFTLDHSSKAFMCARVLKNHKVIVSCNGIDKNELEQMFFRFAKSPQDAIDETLKTKGSNARVLVMPYAIDCVPNFPDYY